MIETDKAIVTVNVLCHVFVEQGLADIRDQANMNIDNKKGNNIAENNIL